MTAAERWTYLGERKGANVAKVSVWRAEDGERIAYLSKPSTRGVVGYTSTASTSSATAST